VAGQVRGRLGAAGDLQLGQDAGDVVLDGLLGQVHLLACDKKLRAAVVDFADDSPHASPWAAKLYADALARTHRHPQAVRILARAWIRVIWRTWQDHTSYDPAKHRGAVRLLATQG
jgi:hypothetical protein